MLYGGGCSKSNLSMSFYYKLTYKKEKQNAQRGMYRLKDSLRKKENSSIHYWYFSLAGFTEQAKTLFQENHKKTFCFFHYRYKKLYSLSLTNHLVIFLLILILLHNNHHNDVLKWIVPKVHFMYHFVISFRYINSNLLLLSVLARLEFHTITYNA